MKRAVYILFLLIAVQTLGQKSFTATVYDAETRSPLAGVQVLFYANNNVQITDEKGKVSYDMRKLPDSVEFSFIGYKDTTVIVNKPSDKVVIRLRPIAYKTQEVIVTGRKNDENVTLARDEVYLTKAELMSLPALMGEQDVIRSFSTNAGVQQFEGMQGIYVRGGSQDQNLIVFDEAIVYNPSHLLGFFSVFNPDIIENAKLYKSGVPAKYGGRLSSVLQISSRKPSTERFECDGSLGLISSRLACNVPLGKKFAAQLSVRKSYLNSLILPLVYSIISPGENAPQLGFYDANAKILFNGNPRNTFTLSAYTGKDHFFMKDSKPPLTENTVGWGNSALTANWLHTSKNNFVTSTSFSYSHYFFSFEMLQSYFSMATETGISNFDVRSVTNKRVGKNLFSFGAENLVQQFNLGDINLQLDTEKRTINNPESCRSNDFSLFVEDNIDISDRFNIVVGLRTSLYSKNDSLTYMNLSVSPRIQARYMFSSDASVKASVSRETQNLHLVSMVSSALPADIWFPASENLEPEKGILCSIGFFKNFSSNVYETSVSLFYKHLNNLVEFKDCFTDIYTHNFYDRITTGKGFACGTELSVAKKQGQFQWSASYSFSRTLRKFAELNDNYWYPATFDRPHDATVTLSYTTDSKKWKFAAFWMYTSGKAYSELSEMYLIAGNLVQHYGAMNNSRMPAYHRLDLSADYQWFIKDKVDAHLQFSIYNAYNRNNPYFISYDAKQSSEKLYSVEKNVTGLFPILPAISLTFHLL